MTQRAASRIFLRNVGVCVAAATCLFAVAYAAGFRFNETESLPPGLWRIHGVAGDALRGAIVHFCPPDSAALRDARDRRYLNGGPCAGDFEPLFKPVIAVAGDRVTVDATGVSVNGQRIANSKPVDVDGVGQRLPALPHTTTTVATGFVWVVSSYTPWSFDSRYFGPIAITSIDGRADPVWTSGSWSGLALENTHD